MERILETLPDETMATILLGSTFVLTEFPEDEVCVPVQCICSCFNVYIQW